MYDMPPPLISITGSQNIGYSTLVNSILMYTMYGRSKCMHPIIVNVGFLCSRSSVVIITEALNILPTVTGGSQWAPKQLHVQHDHAGWVKDDVCW